jgi:hypothetical protein
VLIVALVLAGCGASREGTNVPASSGEDVSVQAPPAETSGDEPAPKPPQILLVSEAGTQKAVQGSYCISGDGSGVCADMAYPLAPKAVSSVQPGGWVTIVLPGVTLLKDSIATVRPLGCSDRETKTIELPESGKLEWQVDLDTGAYQIDVFARFEAADGLSGDTSGSLGLVVSGAKSGDALGVIVIKPSLPVCAFTD